MGKYMITPIVKKSSHFSKHGKHKGIFEIALLKNKMQKKPPILEAIDISKSDWTRR